MDVPLPLPILMDGATGTGLYEYGLPRGECTALWALEHPDALRQLHRRYLDAGAQVLLSPTFAADRSNLARFGLEARGEELCRGLIALTRENAGGKALVAADLAPLGRQIPPYGETPFETLVEIYAEQARACADADLFLIETMISMPEARAALLAVKAVTDKPVWVTFTCDENDRTPTGTDVLAAMIVMQGMGADAFGLNCCAPETALEQLGRLAPYADVPLIVKPSAGLPADGAYPVTPERLAALVPELAAAGARIFGGCCGTTPEHICALRGALERVELSTLSLPERDPELLPCASGTEARFLTADVDIGEPLECSPDLMEDILDAEEAGDGAVKIAIYSQDDLDMFAENQYAAQEALCIETDVPELLEGALRAYQGRAIWDGTAELDDDFLKEMTVKYGLVVL